MGQLPFSTALNYCNWRGVIPQQKSQFTRHGDHEYAGAGERWASESDGGSRSELPQN